MILDTLDHAAQYETLNSRFAKAFAYLRTVDGTQPLGRQDLDGDHCFALVQTYETKPVE
jgi:beta-galactosidase beta subunit